MSYFSYIQASGYTISLSFDEETKLWCASVFELGAMGQGKTKAEALKDLGFALVDLMDSYIKDKTELPTFLPGVITTTGTWTSSEPYKK